MDKLRLYLVCKKDVLLLVAFSMFFVSIVRANAPSDEVETKVENLRQVFLMDGNRKKRMAVDAALGIGISVTAFIVGNIRQAFDNSGAEKSHQELMAHFEQIHRELEQQAEELQSINREIQNLGLSLIFSQHEVKIKDSFSTFREYLGSPEDNNRNLFVEKTVDLDKSIRVLVDGLLGQHVLSPDIMIVVRNAVKCNSGKLHKNVVSIESLIMIGLEVRREYQRIANVIKRTSSSFNEYIEKSLIKLKKRLNDLAIECQADEKNVSNEMRSIMEATLSHDRETMARSLLEFLEEKYETKKWIVIMIKKYCDEHWDSAWTGKFHHVSVGDNAAFAISVNREGDYSETQNVTKIHLEWFQPYAKKKNGPWACLGSFEIEEYLNRRLIPIRAKSGVELETLVVISDNEFRKLFVTSKGMEEWIFAAHHRTNRCYYGLFVIPTKPISYNQSLSSPSIASRLRYPIDCSYDPDNAAENYGPLRNERSQAYLSVQGDSRENGAYIILDREWRNNPGQKWKFVDSQLRNGYGKCLTRGISLNIRGETIYLYQEECLEDRQDWHMKGQQDWYLQGLQIYTNIERLCTHGLHRYWDLKCLVFKGNVQKDPMFVTVNDCDLLSSSLWYNRNTDCEDALVIPKSFTNGSRPLRNEFSRLFLSVDENYGTEKPWSNCPTQLWKFSDGLLRNDNGKCLAGKGWYVQEVDCADRLGNNGLWTYNEKRQIISKNGYCLSDGGDENGYVYYDYCKGEPRQRWSWME